MAKFYRRVIAVGGMIGSIVTFGKIADWTLVHVAGTEIVWKATLPAMLQGAAAVITSTPVSTILLLCAGAWLNELVDAVSYRREGEPGRAGSLHLRLRIAWTRWLIGSRLWADGGRRDREIDRTNRLLESNGFAAVPAGAKRSGSPCAANSIAYLKAVAPLIKVLGVDEARRLSPTVRDQLTASHSPD